MSQEEVRGSTPEEVVGAQVADDTKLTRAALDLQVIALPKFELECLVKRYFKALFAIAEVECEDCDDKRMECEHNLARKALEIEF